MQSCGRRFAAFPWPLEKTRESWRRWERLEPPASDVPRRVSANRSAEHQPGRGAREVLGHWGRDPSHRMWGAQSVTTRTPPRAQSSSPLRPHPSHEPGNPAVAGTRAERAVRAVVEVFVRRFGISADADLRGHRCSASTTVASITRCVQAMAYTILSFDDVLELHGSLSTASDTNSHSRGCQEDEIQERGGAAYRVRRCRQVRLGRYGLG
jgi:hypothetical protein